LNATFLVADAAPAEDETASAATDAASTKHEIFRLIMFASLQSYFFRGFIPSLQGLRFRVNRVEN
jgi:hypothetical protein